MITQATWSEDTFTGRPADPAENTTFLERLAAGAGRLGIDATAPLPSDDTTMALGGASLRSARGLADLFSAAERQQRLIDSSSARRAAREDVYDRMIAEVRRVTGEELSNPLMRNTTELAGRIGRGEFSGWTDPRLDELIAGREDAFLARLQELKAKHGDRLQVDPFTPIPAQAQRNAAQAEADFKREWSRTDLPVVGQFAAMFGGALVGSREDPLFWLSLPFGGPGKAATAVGRIATAAASNAAANAAFAAVAQPEVQAWRQQIGVKSGLSEALQNVGMAAAIGAVAGGGIQIGGEALRALRGAGDATAVVERAGGFVSDDMRAALRGAERADAADAATFEPPSGINGQEVQAALVDAARMAVEPDAPLPLGSRPVPAGTTDRLAREILDAPGDALDALARLRERPEAVTSALASELDDVRAAGHVATLGDAAFARVQAGEIDPLTASVVARMTDDPARQASLMERIRTSEARTLDEAREVVSDAVRAETAREAAAARMGGLDNHPLDRRAAEIAARDGVSAPVALERVAIEETAADPVARRIMDDVAGKSVSDDGGAAPAGGRADPARADAGSGQGREVGAEPRIDRGGDRGAAGSVEVRRADPAEVRNLVPVVDDSGRVVAVDRASLAAAGERDLFLTDLVTACRV